MITRCAALAKGATKQTVTTEEKGMHRTSFSRPCLRLVLTRRDRCQNLTSQETRPESSSRESPF